MKMYVKSLPRSTAVIQLILNILTKAAGFRLAHAGEFTRRAFMNDKMDLLAVEGLADMIEVKHRNSCIRHGHK